MTTLSDIIASAATRYGQNPADLMREAQIESGGRADAFNPASGAAGTFQFVPRTAAAYGLTNPMDPAASADAAARLMRDNRTTLMHALGRDPTGGELYLAHQQGAGGALKLLSNPDAPAASLVGTKAVIQNGGDQGMTARDFANLWTSKFDGTPAGGGSLSALYAQGATGAPPPAPTGSQMQLEAGAPNPGAVLAAGLPMDTLGAPIMPTRAPTIANGGVSAAQENRRRLALLTGQNTLGALFS